MQTKQEKTNKKNKYTNNTLTFFLKNMKTLYSSENNPQHITQENSSSMQP